MSKGTARARGRPTANVGMERPFYRIGRKNGRRRRGESVLIYGGYRGAGRDWQAPDGLIDSARRGRSSPCLPFPTTAGVLRSTRSACFFPRPQGHSGSPSRGRSFPDVLHSHHPEGAISHATGLHSVATRHKAAKPMSTVIALPFFSHRPSEWPGDRDGLEEAARPRNGA